jgi:hypothetical protein
MKLTSGSFFFRFFPFCHSLARRADRKERDRDVPAEDYQGNMVVPVRFDSHYGQRCALASRTGAAVLQILGRVRKKKK